MGCTSRTQARYRLSASSKESNALFDTSRRSATRRLHRTRDRTCGLRYVGRTSDDPVLVVRHAAVNQFRLQCDDFSSRIDPRRCRTL